MSRELPFVPILVLCDSLRVEGVEIIFFALKLMIRGYGIDNTHSLLPPCQDVRQHIAETFISHFPDAFFALRFGQSAKAIHIRTPFFTDMIKRALLGN